MEYAGSELWRVPPGYPTNPYASSRPYMKTPPIHHTDPIDTSSMPMHIRFYKQKNPYVKNTIESFYANPDEEGTPQDFGGTAGTIMTPDPETLPSATLDLPESTMTPENKTAETRLVLNKNTIFTLSDLERYNLAKEAEKLQGYSNRTNEELQKNADSQRFFNLSLRQIISMTAQTVVDCMVDLLHYFSEDFGDVDRFFMIFLKDNRIIYIGVFMVMISFLFMIVFLSS